MLEIDRTHVGPVKKDSNVAQPSFPYQGDREQYFEVNFENTAILAFTTN